MTKLNKINAVLLTALFIGVLVAILAPTKASASCESNYGGGETCIYNKNFKIEKKVRLEGDNSWKDKVINVDEGDVIEFKITITNTGEVKTDKMKFSDFLPDELEKISGDLTETWDNFKPGDEKSFKIKVKVSKKEFARNGEFEKCVVNKAEVSYKGTKEGSDTATVCYGNIELKELPKTGATSTIALTMLGSTLVGAGAFLNKKRS